MKLAALSGSLRAGSFNTALLRHAQAHMPAGSTLQIIPLAGFVPFNADLEPDHVPKAVVEAKDIVMAADGLVLASPEYNGGVPGVLKNALDWLSRPPPPKAAALRGKPVALLGATPGGLGTALAQAGWLQILRSLRMELWVGEGPLTVSRAGDAFDQEGRIVDAALAERVEAYIHAFVRSLQR